MKKPLALPLLLALTACATHDASNNVIGPNAKPGLQSQVTDAATAPLADLNLIRADIPPVLIAAQKAPYAVPADASCASLTEQVAAIDAVLGADLDVPPTDANPGLIPRGQAAATKSAIGQSRGAAEGLIPYRSWVRKLSGAERYSREVAAAIAAGTVRRSFLKGMGQAAGCQAPAAPRR